MIYLHLFFEFFKIGLFAVGGGMATIPFLQHLAENTGWYSTALITDMIAISESTPGPIGINMATYVGYNVAGFWGGFFATLGEILPSIIIVTFISMELKKFSQNRFVSYAFYGLRPAVTGLIAAAAVSVLKVSVLHFENYALTGNIVDLIDFKKALFLIVMLFAVDKYKKDPIFYIVIAAVVGVIFKF